MYLLIVELCKYTTRPKPDFLKTVVGEAFSETHPYIHEHTLGQMPIGGGSYHAITAYHW